MLEGIIDSKVKLRILKALLKRQYPIHVSEVARLAKVSKSRASECLRELSEDGILESRIVGRNVIYSISSNTATKRIIEVLRQEEILLDEISKSFLDEIRKIRKGKPTSIALFGSAQKGLKFKSDIDFFVVDGDTEKFYEIASKLTEKFGFRISVMVMSSNEIKQKVRSGEDFAINLLANHKLLYGKKLEDLIW